jgi:AraC-like DNA-binding protein
MTNCVENTTNAVLDPVGRSRAQIVTLKRDYSDGHFFPLHFHTRDQLLYTSTGVMTVRTSHGIWVVPSLRAVWIRARTPHEVSMSGPISLRTLYFKPGLIKFPPGSCCVVNVPSFFKELILFACEFEVLDKKTNVQGHLVGVILDQMQQAQTVPLQLPRPSDPRARRVAETLMKSPGDERTLDEICRSAGGCMRTIERLFQKETGLSIGKWRQQSRLMHALQLVGGGENITSAAVDAGYSTSSAFISSFRNALGTTPRKYFRGSHN